MYLNTDYIEPVELTGYARRSLANQEVNQFTLSRWLPSTNIDDLDYRFTRGPSGLTDAASYRGFDVESPIGKRAGITRVSGELPPISKKIRLGEYDRLKQRKVANEAIADAIESDAENLTRQIAARIELARGDALVNGSVTISEEGVIATVSFNRSGSHSVSASTPWSTVGSATVLQDLLTWKRVYRNTNGENPGVILISDQALGYVMQNAEIRNLAATVSGGPAIVSQAAVAAVFQAYGLPPFEVYDASARVNGSTTRIIAADKLLFLPAPGGDTDLGATLWGTTAESLKSNYGIPAGSEAGIVAGAYETEDPVAIWTKAAAIALPVLVNPDLTFVADVY